VSERIDRSWLLAAGSIPALETKRSQRKRRKPPRLAIQSLTYFAIPGSGVALSPVAYQSCDGERSEQQAKILTKVFLVRF
jgi:hypothetical protein